MSLQPQVGGELNIEGVPYSIAEHPAAPGLPYGQEGRQAVVYQLVSGTDRRALKVFKPRYRVPTLVSLSARLSTFTDLPGLQVCKRTVITARRHIDLVRQYQDLTYAVLMPWIQGPTWMEVLLDGRQLSPQQCLGLAQSLTEVLAAMEERGAAHCDLSGPNLLLPSLAQHGMQDSHSGVELVDVEQFHGPGLERPVVLPGGSSGYAHRTALSGLWQPEADRFAGALLLAEMLGWCDSRVREAAWGESYFEPGEMHRSTDRYQTLHQVLRQRWGLGIAQLLDRVWQSEILADCPTFGEWLATLPEQVPDPQAPSTAANTSIPLGTGHADTTRSNRQHIPTQENNIAANVQAHRNMEAATEQTHFYDEQALLLSATLRDQPDAKKDYKNEADLLSKLFDDATAAYRSAEWARAKELLEEVVRQQPDYRRGNHQAARILADSDRHLLSENQAGGRMSRLIVPVILLLTLLVAGTVAMLQLQEASNRQSRVWAQGTATAQARFDAGATQTALLIVERDHAKASQTAQDRATSTAEAVAVVTSQALSAEATGTAQAQQAATGEGATAQARVVLAQTATAQAQTQAQVQAQATDIARIQATATKDAELTAANAAATTQAMQVQATLTAIAIQATVTRLPAHSSPSPRSNIQATTQAKANETATSVAAQQATMETISRAATAQAEQRQKATVQAQFVQDTARAVGTTGAVATEQVRQTSIAEDARATTTQLAAEAIATAQAQAADTQVAQKTAAAQAAIATLSAQPTSAPTPLVKLPLISISGADGYTSYKTMAISDDGQLVAAVSPDRNVIRVWRVSDGSLVQTLDGHTADIRAVALSPDGRILASGARDRTLKIWRITDGEILCSQKHEGDVLDVAFSPDGALVASAAADRTARLYATGDCRLLHLLEGASHWVTDVVFSLDGQSLVAYSPPGAGDVAASIRVLQVRTGSVLRSINHPGRLGASNVFLSPDGQTVAALIGGMTHFWKVTDGSLVQVSDQIVGILSPDWQTFAKVEGDGTFTIRRLSDATVQSVLQNSEGGVLVFSPSGSLAGTWKGDRITIWRIR